RTSARSYQPAAIRRRASATRASRTTPAGETGPICACRGVSGAAVLRLRRVGMGPLPTWCEPERIGSAATVGRSRREVDALLLPRIGTGRRRTLLRRRLAVLLLDARVDLLAVHLHLGRRLDAELHLSRAHLEDGDLHGVPDSDVLS